MTTHLLRFDPDLQRASQWMAVEGLTASGQADDGYGWHALLCAVFGKANAPKPFRILARRGRPVELLAYSPLSANELIARAANCADPKAYTALRVDHWRAKRCRSFRKDGASAFRSVPDLSCVRTAMATAPKPASSTLTFTQGPRAIRAIRRRSISTGSAEGWPLAGRGAGAAHRWAGERESDASWSADGGRAPAQADGRPRHRYRRRPVRRDECASLRRSARRWPASRFWLRHVVARAAGGMNAAGSSRP